MSDWLESRGCRDADPDLFVLPVDMKASSAEGARRTATARRFCALCPVRAACREYAIADPSLVGMWGGTTTEERRRLRKGREPHREGRPGPLKGTNYRPIPHGTERGYEAHRRQGVPQCVACRSARSAAMAARKAARRSEVAEFRRVWAQLDTTVMRVLRERALEESWQMRREAVAA